jgi:hypothetical protein
LQTEIARLQIELPTALTTRRALNRSKREKLLRINKSNLGGHGFSQVAGPPTAFLADPLEVSGPLDVLVFSLALK